MTSNPNFTDYVESVQQNLAVFSLTDEEAKRYLMISNPIAEYSPRSIAFEILFNEKIKQEDGTETLERKFDPHVSDKLFEELPSSSYLESLTRLYDWLKRYEYEKLSDIDPVDLAIPEYVEQDEYLSKMTKDNLKELSNKLNELDEIYERLKVLPNISEDDLEKIRKNLYCLLQRYEVQYIPTNVGSTALVYEAWKQGNLVPLGNPEKDSVKFDKLLSGLFVNTQGKGYQQLLKEIAENFGLDEPKIRHVNRDTLSNGKTWKGSLEGWKWYTCVESALVHKLDVSESGNRYLVYYPLLIDDYWFAGVAFTYSESNVNPGSSSIPELFNYEKYSKIYNTIKSVSDTLKISLREEALKQAENKLREGKDKEDVFFEVVQDYFVCFNVRRIGELNKSHNNKHVIYSGHGIQILGPRWLLNLPEKLELVKNEIEGYDASVRHVPGLYKLVDNLAQTMSRERNRARDEGIEEQSQKFAHQAGALANMAWIDPERKKLSSRSRAVLWHLKTVAEVVGKFDLEAERSISEIDFPDWKDSTPGEIIQVVADLSLNHALERATLQRLSSKIEDKKLNKKVNDRAFEIMKRNDKIDEFKRQIGLSLLLDESWPDWSNQKGFILCFYHVFWQASFHAFRAVCGQHQHLQGTQGAYIRVLIGEEQVEIINVAIPPASEATPKSRDTAFFEDINEVLKDYFEIEGSIQEDNYWLTRISRRAMRG